MSKKNFDYKKRMNALRKRHAKNTAAIATSIVLITAPVVAPKYMSLPGDSVHEVSAASLADVNLLQNTNVTTTLSNVDGEDPYNVEFALSGQGLASAELVNTETSAVFYAPDLAGKMAPNGQAEVSVQILPITMGD